ncbi:dephospho-CoA kinase [Apibacter raozihei]|uniref:dephospho-CoA kinase n=1 Tax=Apibacter raozihei TaxID=2500547 RepID=UPI000FE33E1B|nr:dephospho-CoA kinase [Apibacter raozihei]
MKIIGLTGGMGAGKSTVAKIFNSLGYPVYGADIRAKQLMQEDLSLKKNIIDLLGPDAYQNNNLNTKYIAKRIFSDKEILAKQNSYVHAAVKKDFKNWFTSQKNNIFCIREAAILFESGSYKDCDFTIVVTASEEVRIKRILSRDLTTVEEVKKRLDNQWSQKKLVELSDYQIENNLDLNYLTQQVLQLIEKIKIRLGN